MTSENGRFTINSHDIVSEVIEGEVIAIDLARGAYYSLRGGAVEAWRLLAAGAADFDDVVARFNAGADREALQALVDRLVAERLIVPAVDGDDASSAIEEEPVGYTEPLFEKYDDMQDYFLLDPIHDVGAAGWPRPQGELQR
jgi:hypothetical protein